MPAAGLLAGAALLWWVVERAGGIPWHRLGAVWPVVLMTLAWFMLPLFAAAASWRALFSPRRRPPLGRAIYLTWIGLGVNWLLPVAMVGGEIVKYRLGRWPGGSGPALIASLIGDKTQQAISQILFALAGLGLLSTFHNSSGVFFRSTWLFVILGLAAYLFYRAQQAGAASALAARFNRGLANGERARWTPRRIDAEIRALYRRQAGWWRALAWRLLFRLLFAAEIVFVFVYFDIEWTVTQILVMESLAQGARGAAFLIPAGLGAQEGALIGAGLWLGLPGEALLVAALVKRAREWLAGGAALLVWHIEEGRKLLRRSDPGRL